MLCFVVEALFVVVVAEKKKKQSFSAEKSLMLERMVSISSGLPVKD